MLLLLALPAAAGDDPFRDLDFSEELVVEGLLVGPSGGCVFPDTSSRLGPLVAVPRSFDAEMTESLTHLAPLDLVEEPPVDLRAAEPGSPGTFVIEATPRTRCVFGVETLLQRHFHAELAESLTHVAPVELVEPAGR